MNKTSVKDQMSHSEQHKKQLVQLIGIVPAGNGMIKRIRIHQGWWRAFVLGQPEGEYFDKRNKELKKVCNRTFSETTKNDLNFLTPQANQAAKTTLAEREESKPGMIEETRLNCNLLSSQPLCFNFFGELMADTTFGLRILNIWWSDLTELKRVFFEFAPKERYTQDNSAFDIAFEVRKGDKSGLIGLECKYTDTFSSTEYDKSTYHEIYKKSNSFNASYEELKVSKFNQLFRNQLIAEALIQNKKYDFVRTGLFCFQEDKNAISIAKEFKSMLDNPLDFQIITYSDFIENVQRLDINWRQREWTMLLWARYCGTVLSKRVIE